MGYEKKPIVMLKISGKQIDSKLVATQLVRLNSSCLHYVWQPIEQQQSSSSSLSYDGKPVDIDSELKRLAEEALKSEGLASLAINDILPLAGSGDASATLDILWKIYNDTKKKTANNRVLGESKTSI